MKNRMIKLSAPVYEALNAAAQAEGLTPSEWLVAHLPHLAKGDGGIPTEANATDPDAWLEECIVTAPQAVGVKNEQIDADLARAYAEPVSAPPSSAGLDCKGCRRPKESG